MFPLCLILPIITTEIQRVMICILQLFQVSHKIYREVEKAEGRQNLPKY